MALISDFQLNIFSSIIFASFCSACGVNAPDIGAESAPQVGTEVIVETGKPFEDVEVPEPPPHGEAVLDQVSTGEVLRPTTPPKLSTNQAVIEAPSDPVSRPTTIRASEPQTFEMSDHETKADCYILALYSEDGAGTIAFPSPSEAPIRVEYDAIDFPLPIEGRKDRFIEAPMPGWRSEKTIETIWFDIIDIDATDPGACIKFLPEDFVFGCEASQAGVRGSSACQQK